MAKWSGVIGFSVISEDPEREGIYPESITEKKFSGNALKESRNSRPGENIRDDLTLSTVISIIANPYLMENFVNIEYVEYMGAKWSILNSDVEYPRIKLRLGGLYNADPTAITSPS